MQKSTNNTKTTNNISNNAKIINIVSNNKDKKVNKDYTIKNNNIIIN